MLNLVIFDLDGTLINSLEDLGTAINKSLEKMGLPTHSMDEFNYFVGNGIRKLCERSLPQNQQHRLDELYSLFSEYYGSHYDVYTKPYPNIEVVLTYLKDSGIKIAIASNKAESFAKVIVDKIFPNISFDCVKGQTDTRDRKPSPDIIYQTMEELRVSKEETIMVGDSNVDIQTAKNSGIKSIGCVWGFRDYDELSSAGADYISNQPLDLLKLFKSLI